MSRWYFDPTPSDPIKSGPPLDTSAFFKVEQATATTVTTNFLADYVRSNGPWAASTSPTVRDVQPQVDANGALLSGVRAGDKRTASALAQLMRYWE